MNITTLEEFNKICSANMIIDDLDVYMSFDEVHEFIVDFLRLYDDYDIYDPDGFSYLSDLANEFSCEHVLKELEQWMSTDNKLKFLDWSIHNADEDDE